MSRVKTIDGFLFDWFFPEGTSEMITNAPGMIQETFTDVTGKLADTVNILLIGIIIIIIIFISKD